MQLGFVTAILPDLDLTSIVQFAAETGYDCIEVMCWPKGPADRRYSGVTHLDVAEMGTETAKRVNDLSWKSGVKISALGYYPNALTPNPDDAEQAQTHIKRVISACSILGIPQMNTFIGRDWTRNVSENMQSFLKIWKPIIEFAEEQDVRVGIENCPMFFTNDEWPGGKNLASSPALWRQMFDLIRGAHFGLNYDPSHLLWQQMDYIKPLQEFRDRIFHVHAKDVFVDRQKLDDVGILANPLQYHEPRLPGRGQIDWPKFLSALEAIDYSGAVCVEVEDREFEESLDSRKLALKQSYDFLREIVPRD
jgi:sugar phosphate isomerase/epimerase